MLNLLNNIRVVLIEPSHPGNIGAVARSMMTMGLSQLCMVRPKKFPHYEASKRAAGAERILLEATIADELENVVADCSLVLGTSVRDREVTWPTFDPRESAHKVFEHLRISFGENSLDSVTGGVEASNVPQIAILFGRESSGMTNQEMDLCDSQIRIPANDAYNSLNLASAVQIIAYELRMKCTEDNAEFEFAESEKTVASASKKALDTSSPAELRQWPASKAQREGHIQHLQNTLEALDFIKNKSPITLMRKLTRLFNKAELTVEEIQILRGILSAIDTKVITPKDG